MTAWSNVQHQGPVGRSVPTVGPFPLAGSPTLFGNLAGQVGWTPAQPLVFSRRRPELGALSPLSKHRLVLTEHQHVTAYSSLPLRDCLVSAGEVVSLSSADPSSLG